MLPREHGAWAVFLSALIVGAAGGGEASSAAVFAVAAFGLFFARRPLNGLLSRSPERGAARWLAAYGAAAAAAALYLLLARQRWGLLVFALPAASAAAVDQYFRRAGRPLHPLNEACGILALCLAAPAARYAAAAPGTGWLEWLLCALFFLGPIFHVKLAALRHRASVDPSLGSALDAARARSLAWHAGVLAVAAVIAPAWVVVPFAAALAKAWLESRRAPGRVDFKTLGWREAAYAAIFVAAMTAR